MSLGPGQCRFGLLLSFKTFRGNTSEISLDICQSLCAAENQCRFVSYSESSGVCSLFSICQLQWLVVPFDRGDGFHTFQRSIDEVSVWGVGQKDTICSNGSVVQFKGNGVRYFLYFYFSCSCFFVGFLC
jgi:hypothetical protein